MILDKNLLMAALAAFTLVSCHTIGFRAEKASSTVSPTDNTLSEAEKEDGWQLLFDGKSLDGWKKIQGWTKADREPVPENILNRTEGALRVHPLHSYMIIYDKVLDNFVIKMDFQLNDPDGDYSCNSGIFFRLYPLKLQPNPNDPEKPYDIGYNGIELALDQTPGNGYTDTGALYDLARPLKQVVRPNGQWNQLVLTNHENLITVTLNGELVNVIDFDRFNKGGKKPNGLNHKFGEHKIFRNHPRLGYFGFQDHGCPVQFKNIKFLELE